MNNKETKPKKEVFRAFYIGDNFYYKSGNSMSPIYLENGIRTDWGKVQIALKEGNEVQIRQATDNEMLWAYKELEKYNK